MRLILTSAHTRAIPVAEPVTGRCIWPTVLRTRRPGAICNVSAAAHANLYVSRVGVSHRSTNHSELAT